MTKTPNLFDAQQFMELLRGLQHRKISFQVDCRDLECCVGLVVRFESSLSVWEVVFFENDNIEVLRYKLSGDVKPVTSVQSLLSDVDGRDSAS